MQGRVNEWPGRKRVRSPGLNRHCIQRAPDPQRGTRNHAIIRDEFRRRLPLRYAESLLTGPPSLKSVAEGRRLRTDAVGRLFRCRDASRIVTLTGFEGLTMAATDVHSLSGALRARYRDGASDGRARHSGRGRARDALAHSFVGLPR